MRTNLERGPLVIVPAYNEAASLPRVARGIRTHARELEVLVVDDASVDSTREVLADLSVRWLSLPQHLGLGGAMRAGLRYAQLSGYQTAIRLDGDGQHEPGEIERMLEPIRAGRADAVQGSRYLGVPGYRSRGIRRGGQRALAAVLSVLTGERVTDPTSGYWAFGPRAVRILGDHHPTGYPEPELRLFLRRNGLRVAEVPIGMRRRLSGQTSLTMPRVGLAMARVLLAIVVVPLRASVAEAVRD
jgi:glycosyltransferase involved in cell wall biosynthesis